MPVRRLWQPPAPTVRSLSIPACTSVCAFSLRRARTSGASPPAMQCARHSSSVAVMAATRPSTEGIAADGLAAIRTAYPGVTISIRTCPSGISITRHGRSRCLGLIRLLCSLLSHLRGGAAKWRGSRPLSSRRGGEMDSRACSKGTISSVSRFEIRSRGDTSVGARFGTSSEAAPASSSGKVHPTGTIASVSLLGVSGPVCGRGPRRSASITWGARTTTSEKEGAWASEQT